MKNFLTGLYWYYKYNKRIVIPMSKSELATLKAVANSWKHGVPEPIYFGMCMDLPLREFLDCTGMRETATDVIEDSFKVTASHLAAYSLFPVGKRELFQFAGDFNCMMRVGWKQMFQWRPTCGSSIISK